MTAEVSEPLTLVAVRQTAKVNPHMAVVQAFGALREAIEALRIDSHSSRNGAGSDRERVALTAAVASLCDQDRLPEASIGIIENLHAVYRNARAARPGYTPDLAIRYANLAFFMADKIREAAAAAEQSA